MGYGQLVPIESAPGHAPGALNIPLHELALQISELDPDQEIVVYCRGACCVISFEAVPALRVLGYRDDRLGAPLLPSGANVCHPPSRMT